MESSATRGGGDVLPRPSSSARGTGQEEEKQKEKTKDKEKPKDKRRKKKEKEGKAREQERTRRQEAQEQRREQGERPDRDGNLTTATKMLNAGSEKMAEQNLYDIDVGDDQDDVDVDVDVGVDVPQFGAISSVRDGHQNKLQGLTSQNFWVEQICFLLFGEPWFSRLWVSRKSRVQL